MVMMKPLKVNQKFPNPTLYAPSENPARKILFRPVLRRHFPTIAKALIRKQQCPQRKLKVTPILVEGL